jgi:hypothetical protein
MGPHNPAAVRLANLSVTQAQEQNVNDAEGSATGESNSKDRCGKAMSATQQRSK